MYVLVTVKTVMILGINVICACVSRVGLLMAGLSTIVEYLKGDGDVGYRCGYCKNPNGSFSRGEISAS